MKAIRTKIKKATATPKGRIIFFGLLLIILLGLAGGLIYWRVYRKQIIREKLEGAIREKSKGLYQLKYDKLELDEVAGNLSVLNLNLQFDSLKYVALENQQQAPPTLMRIRIPQIVITGVKTPRALIDKEVVGRRLQINSPVIEMFYTNSGKDSARNTPTKEVYEQILGQLNLIRMDTIEITNATISTTSLKTGRKNIELANTHILLVGVQIDSLASEDKSRILFSKEIELTTAAARWTSENRLYEYGIDSIWMQSRTGNMTIRRFFISPQKKEDDFVRSLPFQDDRFDFDLSHIGVYHVDIRGIFNDEINIDSVVVKSSSFRIYRDLSLRRDKKSRVGTYPQQAVAKVPIPLEIKKIILSSAYIEYKERSAKTRRAGTVKFTNSYATISNITNHKDTKDKTMNVDISTRFMNTTSLRTNWSFYLFHPNGQFTVKGRLGAIAATQLNVLTEPMGPARMERGEIKEVTFDLTGFDYSMKGNVKMLYDDLKVSVLERDEETKKLEKKKLASFAANIIIKNSNPSGKKDEARVVAVEFERNTNRSLIHMSWKTLFKGIKETVGIKK